MDKAVEHISNLQLVAEQPKLGRLREEFVPPVRILNHAHHLLVYQAIAKGVRIIRVLHNNMDVDALLNAQTGQ